MLASLLWAVGPVHFDEAKGPKEVHMWYDKPNGFFTTTDYFNTCAALRNSPPPLHARLPTSHAPPRARRYLHYIIDPAWEFAISSAGSYEDVIGIQMQRNMTKFDDLPGPADDVYFACASSSKWSRMPSAIGTAAFLRFSSSAASISSERYAST